MIISAQNSFLQIVGRSLPTKNGIRFAFSGTEVGIKLIGSHLSVSLWDEFGNNCLSVWINDCNTGIVIRTHQGQHEYQIPVQSDVLQYIRLVKRTEARCGEMEFIHFTISEHAQLFAIPSRQRKILFVGDSITCGYGIQAADQFCSFVPEEEDVQLTYAGIAARAFNAEAQYICYSGKGIYRNWGDEVPFQNTMTEIVNTILPNNTQTLFDWRTFSPDCIVIALGSNDLGYPSPIDNEAFIAAYFAFVRSVLQKHPSNTPIFCVNSPLLPSAALKILQQAVSGLQQQFSSVHFVSQTRQSHQNGYGADWHPSQKLAAINGQEIITAISAVMPWSITD